MKKRQIFVPCSLFYVWILLMVSTMSYAQLTAYQQVTTKCYNGPTLSFNSTGSAGTLVGNVNFVSGVDIPANHKVVEVIVEIHWSKTNDGSCGPTTGTPDLSEVGFRIFGPGGPKNLAASAASGPFASPVTTSSFAGSGNVIADTTVFRDGYPSLLPATMPIPGRDTVQPNNDSLNFYCGKNPYGFWAIAAIDDPPATGSRLCVHSYCITLVTCDHRELKASCKANPSVALDPSTGIHALTFADIDSVSDVSCLVKNITFSPSIINCSGIGSPTPVTMTIRDHLDSTASCVSMVSAIDNSKPVITNCFPSVWGTRYLGTDGRDTFYAADVTINDNCLPVIKEVRPFFGTTWQPYIVFNCATGFQQFWVRGTDMSGNVDSCRLIVNYQDTVAPTAVCSQDTAFLTNANNGAITVSAINVDGGSSDICPPVTGRWIGYQFAPPPTYTCDDIGADTVRLIVSDASGNLDTCHNAVIVVVDKIPPKANCQNDTIYLNASGIAMAYASNIDNGSTDTCGIDSININGVASIAYNCSHTGSAQSVWLHVFDASGNTDSCQAWVTVRDTFPPVVNCRNETIYVNSSGNATLLADSINNNSLDVCTGSDLSYQIAGSTTASFTCADIASSPNLVTLTVTDTFGNSSSCNAWVTVEDTINPVANCSSPTIYLNNSGIATLYPARLSAGSWDNCGVVDSFVNTMGNAFTTYTCNTIFTPQAATLIVQDASGNTNSCATTVNVVDTVKPRALCEAKFTAQLSVGGTVVVTPVSIDSNSTDNCGLVQYMINGQSSVTYNCSNLGSQSATLTVRDSSGNMSSCVSQVIIQDNIAPVVSCQTSTAYLNTVGTATVTPASVLVFPATSDNCNIASTSFSTGPNIVFNCDSIGPRTVTVLVVDDFGNSSSCVTTITVEDTINPTASCRPVPFTLQLDASGMGCVTPFDIDNGSSDLCNIDTMLVNGVDSFCFNCSNIGATPVTLSVLDSSGNQSFCQAIVIVQDVINPTALCHDTTIYLGATGVATVFAQDIDAGSSDNCSFNITMNGLASITYGCSQVGVNPVQLIATDGSGNSGNCGANITVLDTIDPVANCIAPGVRNVFLDSSCFASIPAAVLNSGSTDNCNLSSSSYTVGGLPNATFTSGNLSTNPNSIILTVTDPNGNSSTCMTTVNVRDTIRPSVTCQPDTVQLGVTGNATVTPNNVHLNSIDNCTSGLNYTINGASSITYTCANIGTNAVTLNAIDSSGNTTSCVTSVVVEDLIAPVASCNPTRVLNLNSGGTFGVLTASMINLGSSDNCGITNYSLSQDTFRCNDIYSNPHTVTLVVTDASGNSDSCTSQITVHDNTVPNASCQTATVYLGTGTVNVTPSTVLIPPTGDNCVTLSSTFQNIGANITYTCDSIGIHPVTVVVTDISGNTASCVTSITVLDTVSPTANCVTVPYTVQLDASGVGFVTPANVNNGSFDFCGISTMLVNGTDSFFYSCGNIGPSAVTLSVLDGTGNQQNCVANIVVNDPVNPTALCHDTILYLGPSGIATLTPAMIDAGSYDNCSFTSTVNGASSFNFNCNQVGTNTSQLIITDISGNTTQCAANVTILDTIDPIANCVGPGILSVYVDNTCFASIPATAINNGSTDNCGNSLTYTVGGLPNATFNATNITTNPNSITLVVRDATGNVSTCNTTVIVRDTIAPVVQCKTDTIQLTGANAVVNPLMINAGSTDNCSVPNLTINGQPSLILDCTNLGDNVVTLIGTDISGNTDSCSTNVYLEDVAAPIASCRLTTYAIIDPTTNLAVLEPIDVDNGSTDNCNIVSYSLSQDTFDCSGIAVSPYSVTMTVEDQSGNIDSCNTQVIVQDTISPVAVCLNDTLFFFGSTISVNAISFDGGSTDNCAIMSFALSQDTFNCPDIGVNPVTLTVTDSSGNTGTCIALITVLDTTASAIAGPTQVLCTSDSTTLGATPATGSLTGTWTSSTGATIISPNDPNTFVSNIPVGVNVFYWTLSNATCANLSQDSVVIHVIVPSPDIALAGTDQSHCEDSIVTLGASPLTTSTGMWTQSTAQANAGVVIANPTDSLSDISGLLPGNSYVFVWELTNGLCGIHATDTVIINIDGIPTDIAMAGSDITCSPDTFILGATASAFGTGMWSTPTTAFIGNPSSPTSFVTNFNQDTTMLVWSLTNGACVDYSTDTMYVILDAIWPFPMYDSIGLVPDGLSSTIDVILNDSLPPNWEITIHTPMQEGQMTNLFDGQFIVDINGVVLNQHFIYEICNSDCPIVCDTAVVTIAIQPVGDCYTPNAFTPNNDGSNDLFIIPCIANTNAKAALYVFNRWGNVVFETDNYESDWDGTHKNQPLPNGVYFYILQIEGKSPQQGSIEIKR